MLVLTRRTGQSIRVGDDIVITVLEATRDQVRIGIRAPRSIGVHREEIYEEILVANRSAAGFDAEGDEGDHGHVPRARAEPAPRAQPFSLAALPARQA